MAVNSTTRPFPWHRSFLRKPIAELYKTLQDRKPEINQFIMPGYKLLSFKSTHLVVLALFRGKHVVIASSEGDYYEIDVLSDYYNEEVRVMSRRSDQPCSVYDRWNDSAFLSLIPPDEDSPIVFRNLLRKSIPENECFRPTWAKCLIATVLDKAVGVRASDWRAVDRRFPYEGLRWLDFAAGYGDRLITAISMNIEYDGFDPNLKLKAGHDKAIVELNEFNKLRDPRLEEVKRRNKQQVHYVPFETAEIKANYYDFVLTSPPFADVELYHHEGKQSSTDYPVLDDWIVKFLFVSLAKAWTSLKLGGYMILHLHDTDKVKICEPAICFIETHLTGALREGVIGVTRHAKRLIRPVWVWQKQTSSDTNCKNLETYFPALHKAYLKILLAPQNVSRV